MSYIIYELFQNSFIVLAIKLYQADFKTTDKIRELLSKFMKHHLHTAMIKRVRGLLNIIGYVRI